MSVFDPTAAAHAFVNARLAGRSLPEYPGPPPSGVTEAYACQDAAIDLWPDELAGWKVGRIPAALVAEYGADRLAGPVFAKNVWHAQSARATAFPLIQDGFGAVEAEFVFRLREATPAAKLNWSREEAGALDWEVLTGVEIAGSPFPGINDLGPAVTISDFGNNVGVILGAALPDWRERLNDVAAETIIDGRPIGRGSARGFPGGALESVRFLLENAARRGRPLRRGQIVSSGALTGVHAIRPGQQAQLVFDGVGEISCEALVRSSPPQV